LFIRQERLQLVHVMSIRQPSLLPNRRDQAAVDSIAAGLHRNDGHHVLLPDSPNSPAVRKRPQDVQSAAASKVQSRTSPREEIEFTFNCEDVWWWPEAALEVFV
jgi:hypothetical protein